MSKNKAKKRGTALVLLFSVTYMVSYITRINYGAIISEMETATGMSKSLLSLSLTGSFITYGAGQIVTGFLGDRFSPKNLVSFGLGLSVLMNVAVPFCNNPYLMLVCWCINGFAQSFMWPPIVKLMSANFEGTAYDSASVKVSWGSSIGTILIYLCAPLLISVSGWKWVFWVAAIFGAVMILLWNLFCPAAVPEEKSVVVSEKGEKNSGFAILFSPMMIAIMLAIMLQGMLRDGVTTWMPSYISETYSLGNEISILTGVVMPIFSIVSFQITAFLHRTIARNPITCAGIIFAAGAVSAIALYIVTGKNAVASVVLSAIITAAMHGVNLMLICMVPRYFKKYGNVSTVSGVLNSCTYVGSAVSTYGIALISNKYSWSVTLLIWFFIAAVGTTLCFICIRRWKVKMGA